MGGGETRVLLNCEQLPPLIASGVSSEDTSATHRRSWWLPKARAATTLAVGPSSVLGLNPQYLKILRQVTSRDRADCQLSQFLLPSPQRQTRQNVVASCLHSSERARRSFGLPIVFLSLKYPALKQGILQFFMTLQHLHQILWECVNPSSKITHDLITELFMLVIQQSAIENRFRGINSSRM